MRGCYIRTGDSEQSGCRGGVGSGRDSEEYALEIGQNCNAELPMVALCSHIDEILEFLNKSKSESSLAYLILKSMKDTEKDLERQLEKTAGDDIV
jgi:hypothetical protein